MNFRQWCESSYGNTVDEVLADDEFVHFTPMSRAKQILQSGKLLMEPPYKKFGTDTVDAVSVKHGMWQPGVQLAHTKTTPDDPIVAVLFKTNLHPYAAYPEEVKWNVDVPLIGARVISKNQAQSLLKPSIDKDFEINYR
jgi:hypothetical protein